ncbi:TetR/AcrR family transcriptional regulator [Nonomuraea longicatena]|uniref:TetR/AcrR family transcriptional regulator n=1 Tax=Nonomuraea longicatena TaxID=83682 RepID=A0ABN1NYK1_9ACTN
MEQEKASTRERLIASAVRLFGEKGIAATSMRALTEAAEANIASVNYHFGSKEGLLRAVIDQTMRAVNDERRRRLDDLESAAGPPSVAELVRAFVEPAADLTAHDGPDGSDTARFIGRLIGEPDPRVREIFAEQVGPVEGRYLAALGRALPALGDERVRFAFTCMVGLLGLHQTGAFRTVDWRPRDTPPARRPHPVEREELVAFITGGMLANLP